MTSPAFTTDPDDEDLDARAELGYGSARRDEPDDQDERAAPPPAPPAAEVKVYSVPATSGGARGDCRFCPARDVLLHQTPSNIHRTACAACIGRMNREQTEYGRETIRQLKAAAARGDAQAERNLIAQLRTIFGAQTEQTLQAIRAQLETQNRGGGR